MKILLVTLCLFSSGAFAKAAVAVKKKVVVPPMTWAVKPMVRADVVLSVEDAKRIYQTTKEQVTSLSNPDVITQMIVDIGNTISHLSSMSQEEAAIEIVNAIFKLSEMGERAKRSTINGNAAFSFVLFPTPISLLEENLALDDFETLSRNLLTGMNFEQERYRQSQVATDDGRTWYFLGAVGNVRVSNRGGNEMHLQLVLGLKPQTIVSGGNKVEIPSSKESADAPVAILDFSMPMDVTLPRIEMTFGKIGELKPAHRNVVRDGRYLVDKSDWRFRFQADEGHFCSRAGSTPRVLQDKAGMTLQVPLYYAKIDGNTQSVTEADVRLAGPTFAPWICWGVFGVVPNEFIKTVNTTIDNNTFSEMFRLSLTDLAKRVEQLKVQANTMP